MKNKGFSRHWSESDPRVLAYLEEAFKDPPTRPEYRCGYDVIVGDAKIEIKSCQEWIENKGGKGKKKRRRGRFHFDKGTEADMILFVLVKKSGELEFAIRFPEQFGVCDLDKTKIINWGDIFIQ